MSSTNLKAVDWRLMAATLYLTIPNVLFGLYFSPIAFIISAAASFYALWIFGNKLDPGSNLRLKLAPQICLVIISIVWIFLSGVTGHLFSNGDWPYRFTLLNDLVSSSWPVTYLHENQAYFLRAPIGYYLPSAFIGKFFDNYAKIFNSYRIGVWALFIWGVVGVYLTLSIALQKYLTRKTLLFGALVMVLFSGMDTIGHLARYHSMLLGDHLEQWAGYRNEWWAGQWQYPSNTTSLFWAPNHAIAAWIFTALMMRKGDDPVFWNISPILLAMTLNFSPLSFIGCFALYSLYFYKKIFDSIKHNHFYQGSVVIASLVFVVGASFILSGLEVVPKPPIHIDQPFILSAASYLAFILLEFGILALLIRPWIVQKRWFYITCTLLVAIPLAPEFGPGNDLTMRASIPPLFCLCLLSIDGVISIFSSRLNFRKVLVLAVLLIGSITAMCELYRPFIMPRNKFIPDMNFYEYTKGQAGHYYAPCNPQSIVACGSTMGDKLGR